MKTVLITGGNRGIGFEIARQLLARGFHAIIASRSGSHAKNALNQLQGAERKRASTLVLDVSNSASIAAAAAAYAAIAPHLDVLINNAGIYPDENTSILTISREQMQTTFHTNTFGPLEVTQAFVPYLKKASAARVINLSSGYGQLDGLSATVPSYCLSKFALNGVTIMLAEALKEHGIAVNAMCPGWVRTDMGGSGAPRSVEEGADTAVWLATDASRELTGKFFRDRSEIPW